MKVKTQRFGEIEVNENSILNFIKPIIGFEDYSKYVLLEHNEKSPFKWLQSLENPDLALPVSTAAAFNIEYVFEISDYDASDLELTSQENLLVLNVVNVPLNNPQASTMNLLSPILINYENKKTMQIILANSNYTTKKKLFEN